MIKRERTLEKVILTLKELINLHRQLKKDLKFIAKKMIIKINIKKSKRSDFKKKNLIYLI